MHVYDIGQGVIFYVLKENSQVICRHIFAQLTTYDNISEPIKAWKAKYNGNIHTDIVDYKNTILLNEQGNKNDTYGDTLILDKNTEKVPQTEWKNKNHTPFNKINIDDDIQDSHFKEESDTHIGMNIPLYEGNIIQEATILIR